MSIVETRRAALTNRVELASTQIEYSPDSVNSYIPVIMAKLMALLSWDDSSAFDLRRLYWSAYMRFQLNEESYSMACDKQLRSWFHDYIRSVKIILGRPTGYFPSAVLHEEWQKTDPTIHMDFSYHSHIEELLSKVNAATTEGELHCLEIEIWNYVMGTFVNLADQLQHLVYVVRAGPKAPLPEDATSTVRRASHLTREAPKNVNKAARVLLGYNAALSEIENIGWRLIVYTGEGPRVLDDSIASRVASAIYACEVFNFPIFHQHSTISAEGLELVIPAQAAILAGSVEAAMTEHESREVGLSEDEDEAGAI